MNGPLVPSASARDGIRRISIFRHGRARHCTSDVSDLRQSNSRNAAIAELLCRPRLLVRQRRQDVDAGIKPGMTH